MKDSDLNIDLAEHQLVKIFPGFQTRACCQLNVNRLAITYCEMHPSVKQELDSALISADTGQAMIDLAHQQNSVEWSYGGYLEDRSFVLSGSYLKKNSKYFHLGVDINVPQSTALHIPVDSEVLLVDDEKDYNGGWGPRVITRTKTPKDDLVFIWGHLQNIECDPGELLSAGSKFAEIGGAPENGNWWPHLHLQTISYEDYRKNFEYDLEALDGYCTSAQLEEMRRLFPEPLVLL